MITEKVFILFKTETTKIEITVLSRQAKKQLNYFILTHKVSSNNNLTECHCNDSLPPSLPKEVYFIVN